MRIDTVEQALRDLCNVNVVAEGYALSQRLVRDNLALGLNAIADSVNPLKITRDEWEAVATNVGATFVNIEVRCSDSAEHQLRLETRAETILGLKNPTWQQVQSRYYEDWHKPVISIDTAEKSIDATFKELLQQLAL